MASSLGGISLKADPNEIYENIIQSESVFDRSFMNKYLTEKFKDSVNLVDYFEIKPDDNILESLRARRQLLKLLDKFRKVRMQTDVARTTKILTVSIRMPNQSLLLMLLIDLLNRLIYMFEHNENRMHLTRGHTLKRESKKYQIP